MFARESLMSVCVCVRAPEEERRSKNDKRKQRRGVLNQKLAELDAVSVPVCIAFAPERAIERCSLTLVLTEREITVQPLLCVIGDRRYQIAAEVSQYAMAPAAAPSVSLQWVLAETLRARMCVVCVRVC